MGTFNIEDALASGGTSTAINAAQSIIGMGIGRLDEKHQDKRQLEQQGKLQALQLQGSMALTDYQQRKQLEMWEKTGYSAQKEQMIKAGLNPALLYGMSGGGGQTIGGGTPQVSGGNAAPGGNSSIQAMGMMLQNQNMAAQAKLLAAQAKNVDQDTTLKDIQGKKLEGVDTELGTTQIEKLKTEITNIIANTQNTEAKTALTKIQTNIETLNKQIKDRTLEDVVSLANQEYEKAYQTALALKRANHIGDETQEATIKIASQTLANMIADKALTQQKTRESIQSIIESQSKVKLNEAQINKMTQDILQGWYTYGKDLYKDAAIADNLRNETKNNNMTAGDKAVMNVIEGVLQAVGVGGAIGRGLKGK